LRNDVDARRTMSGTCAAQRYALDDIAETPLAARR
jgi:hypothetical protein